MEDNGFDAFVDFISYKPVMVLVVSHPMIFDTLREIVGPLYEPVSSTKEIFPQSLIGQYGSQHAGFYYSFDLEAAQRDIYFFYPNRIVN
jgi:nucleoside diphosphate kinase